MDLPLNSASKINQKPWENDAKKPSHVELMSLSILDRFFLPTSTPRTINILVFSKRKNTIFSKNRFSQWTSTFNRCWCQLASNFLSKINQNRIKIDLDRHGFLVDFWRIWPPSWDPSWGYVGYFLATRRLPQCVRALKTPNMDLDFGASGPRFWSIWIDFKWIWDGLFMDFSLILPRNLDAF